MSKLRICDNCWREIRDTVRHWFGFSVITCDACSLEVLNCGSINERLRTIQESKDAENRD